MMVGMRVVIAACESMCGRYPSPPRGQDCSAMSNEFLCSEAG